MKAIILAAGRGNRLGSYTKDRPKCLIELDGKPLIKWQLDAMQGAGISQISIVVGYLAEKIKFNNITYFENINWETTNMVSSLLCASSWLESNTCIVSYSDVIYPAETIIKLSREEKDLVIAYNTEWLSLWEKRFKNPLDDAETFKINSDGTLLELGKKASNISEIEGQYMGLLKFTPCSWKVVKDYLTEDNSQISRLDMTSLLGKLLTRGVKIYTVPIRNRWFEIDNERDIALYPSLLNVR